MKGTLKLAGNKKTWLLVREDGKEMQVPARALSRNLFPLDATKHEGVEVEYELDKGQPSKVYEAGAEWQPQASPAHDRGSAMPRQPNRGPGSKERPPYQSGRAQSTSRQYSRQQPRLPGDFHNPYNFIPAPPRKTDHPELGDHKPAGHDRYQEHLWSGRIAIKLTTQTPLLIMDGGLQELFENDRKRDHKIQPVRLSADGRPILPSTSIKGMLRSAFEAITNSRFGIFAKHQDRLAYRMAAKIGPIPARVENRNGKEGLRLMQANVIGFAAKLPRYEERSTMKDKGELSHRLALTYPDGTLPKHGDDVWVQIDRSRVTKVVPRGEAPRPEGEWIAGWACVTGPNINKKRFERVFLKDDQNDRFISIEDKHKDLWRELIQNYQEEHKKDLLQRFNRGDKPEDYLGDAPGKTGWSRHIYEKAELELREGTLCYVEFLANSTSEIGAIIPVTISRRLFSASPDDLLPDSLKPAQKLDQLSPAERVFGWVHQKGPGAYRGNLRIGPVHCMSPDPIESFEGQASLPLAILGQPKPQQTRFYVGQSKQGEAQPEGQSKEQAGYLLTKGLRGRKVYPHHSGLPENYWTNPLEDRTQNAEAGFFQEYRRPHQAVVEFKSAKLNPEKTGFVLETSHSAEQRDDQNRSIKGWIRPQITFEFDIDVTNLSDCELGGLLWLLTLPDGYFHRLGGGKPLGFGSVRLETPRTELHRGRDWISSYRTLDGTDQSDDTAPLGCVREFEETVAEVYGNGDIGQVGFIEAFKRSAHGFNDGKPLHYPRALQPGQRRNGTITPHPEGKAFEWFVANERTGRDGGPKLSLPDLASDEGLPIL